VGINGKPKELKIPIGNRIQIDRILANDRLYENRKIMHKEIYSIEENMPDIYFKYVQQ
jgi:hypothetical protein